MAADPASAAARATKTVELSDRNACDVELLTVGAFSPLTGFMTEEEYQSVVDTMRLPVSWRVVLVVDVFFSARNGGLLTPSTHRTHPLALTSKPPPLSLSKKKKTQSGLLFGLPVVMDTSDPAIAPGDVLLLTYKGKAVATMDVTSKWAPNKAAEADKCYGTPSLAHPAVSMIATERGRWYLGGPITGLALPEREFPCATPAEVRATLPAGVDVLAFQCRNPIHRAHYELFTRALDDARVRPGAVCLVHPTVGPTQDDDIPGLARYHTYEVLKKEVANPRLRWAYLPYSMHMAGPREAIQHMLIRKNYGATHFIIGRDMAGCKSSLTGEDFYGAYDAQDTANAHAEELGVATVPSLNIVYTEEKGYVTADVAAAEKLHTLSLSGTKFRQMLRSGGDIPEWFAFKSVVEVLRNET
jgi:sulfate adenylyltransferase